MSITSNNTRLVAGFRKMPTIHQKNEEDTRDRTVIYTDRHRKRQRAKQRGSRSCARRRRRRICRYCTFFLFWANFWAVCQAWNKADRRIMG